MSNYPPGVSGNEPQIAGYDETYLTGVEHECGRCGETSTVDVERVFYGFEYTDYWTCPFQIPEGWDDEGAHVCGYENETTEDAEDYREGDGDAWYWG